MGISMAIAAALLGAIILAAAVFTCLQLKPLKKLHPIVFIGLAAVVGVVFQL